MSGSIRSSADLDPRRRRILFRAWHRGTREMDLLMGRFTDAAIDDMSDSDLDVFELLIEAPDRDLFAWLTDAEETPANYNTSVFQSLKAFHRHGAPIHV